ncbi:hypothetical protein [Qipengyuania sp.]|uniref:hypothetical protein n=1 Tax=Qipengyuania sp. TaxID=2004515 RepID=UPI00373636CF
MEFEIHDEPQGEQDRPEGDRDGGLEDHQGLQNQSRVKPEDYPLKDRQDQSLVTEKGKG